MKIDWDDWAVPTITGDDDLDVVRGVGYAQAVAHATQVLEQYGLSRGTAAAMWGPRFIPEDTFTVELGLTELTDTWYDAQLPETLDRIAAFCDGFNAACADEPGRGGDRRDVLPVTPRDVIGHVARIFVRFTQIDRNQLAFGPEAFYATAGSNGWAVSGARSSTGNAMLVINPHLTWSELPHLAFQRFFEFRTTSPGRDFHGCTLLGAPWQSMGYSSRAGWGHTVNPIQNLVAYELDLVDGTYAFGDERLPLEAREVKLEVLGAEPVVVTARRSVHGPVVTAPDGTTVAVRMSGILDSPCTTALESWWQLSLAGSVEELFATHDRFPLPMFHMVAADSAGSVGALYCGTPFVRDGETWADAQQRLPGSDPSRLLEKVHPASAMPRVIDPPSGWVQNCNEAPWLYADPILDESAYPAAIAPPPTQVDDLRHVAARAWLAEHDRITPEQLLALKFNKRALLADIVLDELCSAAEAEADLQQAVEVLRSWDRHAHADSAGYPLFWLWMALHAPAIVASRFLRQADELGGRPPGLVDVAGGVELLRAAVVTLGALGVPLDATLGQVVTVGSGDDRYPADGGSGMVGCLKSLETVPAATGMEPSLGDTWVSLVQFSADGPPTADSLLVYGNTTEPGAPPSRSQWAQWVRDSLRLSTVDPQLAL